MRLTVAQALVRFLSVQHSERDGVRQRLIAGCFGIFGHGNVAGVGQALLEAQDTMPFYHARNEQAMVHTAAAFARQKNRLSTLACTSSIGPGATNMVTGAALATINRLPVLLLPGDVFATRAPGTVLQQLEDDRTFANTVNDTLRPVSKFWDRIERPEQLAPALLAAMRVLSDPAETGAVTLALPQDVQAEAYDFPDELFEPRVWRIRRPLPEPDVLEEAVALLRGAQHPLIVSGGGTIYAEATEALRELAEATGIGVGETQAGKGSLPYDHPQALGAIGATGTTAANAAARAADVILGVGTRWSDFTTASRSLFAADATFINLNVASVDAFKHAGMPLVADARLGLEALNEALNVTFDTPANDWDAVVERAYTERHDSPSQAEVIGVVNRVSGPRDVVVCAAGSMPGDLHKLWRTRDPKGYHVEYGYSTMGYEIAGGLGVKLAAPDREVFVMVGDGSYLMMASEIATAVAEGIKLTIVLVQNHGYQSIGALSESVGSQRFGTAYRFRGTDAKLPIDLAANAASLGARAIDTHTIDEFEAALREAAASETTTVVQIHTDPMVGAPDSEAWWDVPVAEVAALASTRDARAQYERDKATQRTYLGAGERRALDVEVGDHAL
ncbi:3D-(3,5/4)-trihydroxycyclohexane-1,2-dione acylhydrolase (decyclizing) [Solirubrobacter sp. CPCC 204708]|uniref:3D-(3,5/4)-trihydroxycyclohexane-1,2-dione acylhydrolase (Decyclizing) n=1 Tax=Solirubrobacter deserti TaxID=2282478 RepID=A0ABT4RJW5_9ACTN|nr:3D-(3,5/4)-trihydroxycyclohexane-1,2-dione acylhydrolase (decyclizing) [Solirubrobacter deserti]MBE2315851.1 3D-(3,5/4)-trihydroxycyclohexane-1,2-dione acylhydrolase (decyclizing) [Solirubrobacter deserti]MDA0138812.1 3D-(3,5/4)-trihydroxycyclohexane-1,2-dione acylhydrolase (decyclizing) [Solirubrobacter deserti]